MSPSPELEKVNPTHRRPKERCNRCWCRGTRLRILIERPTQSRDQIVAPFHSALAAFWLLTRQTAGAAFAKKSPKGCHPPCRHSQSRTPYRVGGTEKWFALAALDRSSTDRADYHLTLKQSIIPTSFAPLVQVGDVRTFNRATGILHSPRTDSPCCATVLQPLCGCCSELIGLDQVKQLAGRKNLGPKVPDGTCQVRAASTACTS